MLEMLNKAKLLQSERQSLLAEKLQKDAETLSQEEIADMQKRYSGKINRILEFHVWVKFKLNNNETADKGI